MNNKISKIISLLLVVLMMFSYTTVFASSTGSNSNSTTIGEDIAQDAKTTYDEVSIGTTNTDVYLTVDNSDIVVGVPVEIIVSGTPNENGEYIGNYSVEVNGDIAGGQTINVIPDENVFLKQIGKNDVSAVISQEKTQFTYNDIEESNNTSNGKVSAIGLTAGSWAGEFSFNVFLYDYYKTAKIEYFTWTSDTTINQENPDGNTTFDPENRTAITGLSEEGVQWLKDNNGNLTFPENATAIYNATKSSEGAFSGDKYDNLIYNVSIPSNIKYVGDYAFYKQFSLKKLNIEEGVERLGKYSFAGSTNSSVRIWDDLKPMNITNDIILPNSLKQIDNYAFYINSFTNIKFGNSLETIGNFAFLCSLLNCDLDFPDSLKSIGNQAFGMCYNISGLHFGSELKTIGASAFHCTYNVNDTTFSNPKNIENIGNYAFMTSSAQYDWTLLENATFGELAVTNKEVELPDYSYYPCFNEHPFYSQIDPEWGLKSIPVGTSTSITFSTNGCGWCSLTSIYDAFYNENMNPYEFTNYLKNTTDIRTDNGTNSTIYKQVGDALGFKTATYTVGDNLQPLFDALNNGGFAIITVANGSKYSGHAYLCYGVDESGKILIQNTSAYRKEGVFGSLYIQELSDYRNTYTVFTK